MHGSTTATNFKCFKFLRSCYYKNLFLSHWSFLIWGDERKARHIGWSHNEQCTQFLSLKFFSALEFMAKSIFRLWSTVCKNVYNFSSRRFADYSRIDEDQLSLYLCAGRGGNGLARCRLFFASLLIFLIDIVPATFMNVTNYVEWNFNLFINIISITDLFYFFLSL